jgi:hypothetical protein
MPPVWYGSGAGGPASPDAREEANVPDDVGGPRARRRHAGSQRWAGPSNVTFGECETKKRAAATPTLILVISEPKNSDQRLVSAHAQSTLQVRKT